MSKYNIVLITVDSWNRNFVGCFNDKAREENLTPHLNKFSEQCVVFPSAFSGSVKTSVSVLSILSGCCPCKYGDWYSSISANRTMISEILRNHGYKTYGFTSNPCTSSLRNYDRGYDIFVDDNVLKNVDGIVLKMMLFFKTFFKNPYSSADIINKQVLYHLKHESPYFINIHYMDLHGPYISRKGSQFINRISSGKLWNKAIVSPEKISIQEKENMIAVYKDQMNFLDYHLGELIEKIDNDNTMIIITGDHADVFGDRGYFGHPFMFYNEMINVPLLVKLPAASIIRRRVCEQPVSLMDIVPTMIDIAGINAHEKFDGNSLLPLIQNNDREHKTKYIISEISRKHASVIRGNWKLIADFERSSLELYDWVGDAGEQKNLSETRPDIRHELEQVLRFHIINNKIDYVTDGSVL